MEDSKVGYLLAFLVAVLVFCATAERMVESRSNPDLDEEANSSVLSAFTK